MDLPTLIGYRKGSHVTPQNESEGWGPLLIK
jgi:hypothetical protein